ncbi:mitochondrial import protein Pam17 [Trichodelitschia bisporula]|uniref:Presequence translocated-associated motor subunit PAM17 n=1 Tax=Trichodelitschia bisporula TaxID=703511 RepID=A0A6G1IAX0_9PEZI|nr:mitochondrial import protein Pam17 [Trichodelitschia bisporula]
MTPQLLTRAPRTLFANLQSTGSIAPLGALSVRHASTTAPPSTGTGPTQTPQATDLTWNTFLALRRTRRRINLACSAVSGAAALVVGTGAALSADVDSVGAQALGLDPMIVLGLSGVVSAAGGWLAGPVVGNAVFRVVWRGWRGGIEKKEKEFYARIKKHRVDPSSSSISNPVPDYYGEKIGSVADYRRWLKDQRAFNLKRGKALV